MKKPDAQTILPPIKIHSYVSEKNLLEKHTKLKLKETWFTIDDCLLKLLTAWLPIRSSCSLALRYQILTSMQMGWSDFRLISATCVSCATGLAWYPKPCGRSGDGKKKHISYLGEARGNGLNDSGHRT